MSKEEKQKSLFKMICTLADENNKVKSSAGVLYKTIIFHPALTTIEEIREWSEEE